MKNKELSVIKHENTLVLVILLQHIYASASNYIRILDVVIDVS